MDLVEPAGHRLAGDVWPEIGLQVENGRQMERGRANNYAMQLVF